jgi:hypothetical protein
MGHRPFCTKILWIMSCLGYYTELLPESNSKHYSFLAVDAFARSSHPTTTTRIRRLDAPSVQPHRGRTTNTLIRRLECPLPEHEDITFPHPDLTAVDVANLCMDALQCRPPVQSLEICFNFSSDRCRAAVGGSLSEFIQYASNPVFGALVHCDEFKILSIGPIIEGGKHRGAMQTVLFAIKEPPRAVTVATSSGGGSGNNVGSVMEPRKRRPSALERRQLREQKERGEGFDDEDEYQEPSEKEEGGKRRFLWTFQQERRPPRQDCWLVHEVLFVKNAFDLTT